MRLERLAGVCAAILHLRVRYLPGAVLWPHRGLARTAREPGANSRARTWRCGPPRLGGLGPPRSASRSAPPAAHWPAAGDAPEEEPGRAGRGSPGAQPWAVGRRPAGSPASRTAGRGGGCAPALGYSKVVSPSYQAAEVSCALFSRPAPAAVPEARREIFELANTHILLTS